MIRLDDDLVIRVDSCNYTLSIDKHKKTTDKNGNEYDVFEPIGYFSSLESALKGAKDYYIRKCCMENELTLNEAIKAVNLTCKSFEKIVNKVLNEVTDND